MDFTRTEDGDVIVVALRGDIDLENSRTIRELLLGAVGDADGVVVDMSGVATIDSSGIASLLEAYQTARKQGKHLILADIDDTVLRVLKLARLDTIFALADDAEAAKRALA